MEGNNLLFDHGFLVNLSNFLQKPPMSYSSNEIKYDFDNESVTSSRFTKLSAPLSIKQEPQSSTSRNKQIVENPFARKKPPARETTHNPWSGAAHKVEESFNGGLDTNWIAPHKIKYEDDEHEVSNPWSVRNAQSLRAPLDSSLHFPTLSERRHKPVEAMSSTSSVWSAGRGKLIMQREPSPPGTSSVVIKRELSSSPEPSPPSSPPPRSYNSSVGRGFLIKREPSPLDSDYGGRGNLNIR